jgi:hypothetical protein
MTYHEFVLCGKFCFTFVSPVGQARNVRDTRVQAVSSPLMFCVPKLYALCHRHVCRRVPISGYTRESLVVKSGVMVQGRMC